MTLYVGNLAMEATEDDLFAAFREVGEVVSTRVIYHAETGRPKGFGFVRMGNEVLESEAMRRLEGAEVAGKRIAVREARKGKERRNNDRRGTHKGSGKWKGPDRRNADRRRNHGCRRKNSRGFPPVETGLTREEQEWYKK
jgi:RNA recognition motif-containing protein